MDEKAASLVHKLSGSFESSAVTYEFTNDLHRFRVEWGPTHWIYIPRAYVEARTESELRASFERWRIADMLRSSQRSRCLLLGERGLLEVNSSYGRGRN